MLQKIILIVLCTMLVSHQTHASLKLEQTLSFSDDQKNLLVVAGLAATGIGVYLWYKNTANPAVQSQLNNHHKRTLAESSKNGEFQKFVQKFSPPGDLLDVLVSNEQTIYEKPRDFNTAGYAIVAKGTDLSRIITTHRMNNYIEQKEYTSVGVPKKYVFLTGDVWTVIAERIDERKDKHSVTLKQMQEAVDVVENMGYSDFDAKNLIFDKRGKIFFIDTEEESFVSPIGKYQFGVIEDSDLRDNDTAALCKEKHLNLKYFREYFNSHPQEKAAQDFLIQRIEKLEGQYENSKETYTKVTGRTDLDNHDINMNALNTYIKPLVQSTRGICAKPRDYFKN